MVSSIIWTVEAKNDVGKIVLYLQEEWGQKSAEKFTANLLLRLDKLIKMPTIAPRTSKAGIQMYKLDKKNVLFFMVEGEALVVLSIYPYKKDIYRSRYY